MSVISDIFFGDKGQGPSAQDVTPKEYKDIRPDVAQAIKDLISSGGGPSYGGDMVAPISDQEQKFIDLIGSIGGGDNPFNQAIKDLTGRTVGGDFLSPDSNPYLQDAIDLAQRRTLENYFQYGGENSRVRSAFTSGGHQIQGEGSSAFDRARNTRENQLLQNLGDIATQIVSGNYQAERTRQQEAANFGNQLTNDELTRSIESLKASQLPRLVEQLGIDRGIEEFNRRINVLLQAIGLGGSVSAPNIVQFPGVEGTTGLIGSGGSFDIGTAIGNIGQGANSIEKILKLIK